MEKAHSCFALEATGVEIAICLPTVTHRREPAHAGAPAVGDRWADLPALLWGAAAPSCCARCRATTARPRCVLMADSSRQTSTSGVFVELRPRAKAASCGHWLPEMALELDALDEARHADSAKLSEVAGEVSLRVARTVRVWIEVLRRGLTRAG